MAATLEMTYSDNCLDFKKDLVKTMENYSHVGFVFHNETNYKEKSAAYKFKGAYSAKKCPFVVYKDRKHTVPFYSEDNSCTIDNIVEILERYSFKAEA